MKYGFDVEKVFEDLKNFKETDVVTIGDLYGILEAGRVPAEPEKPDVEAQEVGPPAAVEHQVEACLIRLNRLEERFGALVGDVAALEEKSQ